MEISGKVSLVLKRLKEEMNSSAPTYVMSAYDAYNSCNLLWHMGNLTKDKVDKGDKQRTTASDGKKFVFAAAVEPVRYTRNTLSMNFLFFAKINSLTSEKPVEIPINKGNTRP